MIHSLALQESHPLTPSHQSAPKRMEVPNPIISMPEAGGSPTPLHYICRSNGDCVALVALDDLPPTVQIAGHSRYMKNPMTAAGLAYLGVVPKRMGYYSIEIGSGLKIPALDLSSSSFHAPDALVCEQARPVTVHDCYGTQLPPRAADSSPIQRSRSPAPLILPASRWQSSQTESSAPSSPSPPLPRAYKPPTTPIRTLRTMRTTRSLAATSILPAPKIYCTHWIFHGECAFIHSSRGCRFKHEMPLDPEIMAQVGLKAHPKWWVERQSVTLRDLDWRAPEKEYSPPGTDPTVPFTLPPAPVVTAPPHEEGVRATRLFGRLLRPESSMSVNQSGR